MRVLIRADGGPEVGSGHVMRCLALAQALADRGAEVDFLSASLSGPLARRLHHEGIAVDRIRASPGSAEDRSLTAERARHHATDWIVLDGYRFEAGYVDGLQQAGPGVVLFDDGRRERYGAEIVVNPNISADPQWYAERVSGARLLLGPRYAPLRREFATARVRERSQPTGARRVLVTLGGADAGNVTASVLESLRPLARRIELAVVIGPDSAHVGEVTRLARVIGGQVTVAPPSMAVIMAQADLAIVAAGTAALEVAYMGLPSFLIVTADNQAPVAQSMVAAGAAAAAVPADGLSALPEALVGIIGDVQARARIAARARSIVDGRGAHRIARAMRAAITIRLVPAGPEHERLIWEWANDPETRRASFSAHPIPWGQHVRWFSDRLGRRPVDLFVAVDRSGQPVGQVRLEVHGRRGRLPINLAPAARGRGYGSLIVDLASHRLLEQTEIEAIDVYVRPENEASRRAFVAADFVPMEETVMDGVRVQRLERRRDVLPVGRP